jgi:predicted nucleotidyltransferase component of viral defense system
MIPGVLTDRQVAFLKAVGESSIAKNFYLTGGTALTAFYLGHRYSEDLDFFSETEIDTLPLNVFLKEAKSKLEFSALDFQQSGSRSL